MRLLSVISPLGGSDGVDAVWFHIRRVTQSGTQSV